MNQSPSDAGVPVLISVPRHRALPLLKHSAYDQGGCLHLVFAMLCGPYLQIIHQLVMPHITVTVQRLLRSGLTVSVR